MQGLEINVPGPDPFSTGSTFLWNVPVLFCSFCLEMYLLWC